MSKAMATDLLAQNIKVLSGFAFPSEGFNQIVGVPLIRIRDLANSDTEVRFKGRYDPTYLIKKGDVLIGMDGDFEVHRWTGDLALLNQRVCKVDAVTREVDQGFLYWYLKPKVAEIHRRTPQTTVRHLSARDLYLIPMPRIGYEEQAVIAKVLDTLDTAINETEAIIAKLKAVKQGLLHDLLTRGITANGELRPPQAEAPHLYKESPLGWIPKEWTAPVLSELLTGIDAGWSPSCPEEPPSAGEWGVLKVSAVSSGNFDPRESKRLPPNLKPIPSIEVSVGDVLLARANGVAELVATTVLVRETPPRLMLSDKTLRLVPDEERLIAGHLTRAMAHGSTRKQINGMLNGSSGQRNISQGQIRRLYIPVPSLDEQYIGENRTTEIEERITAESQTLQKLISMKSGVMDDLLTGRVRVTPLLAEAAQQQGSA